MSDWFDSRFKWLWLECVVKEGHDSDHEEPPADLAHISVHELISRLLFLTVFKRQTSQAC